MKKISMCLIMIIMCFTIVGGVYAGAAPGFEKAGPTQNYSNFLDIKSYNNIYKMSEDSDIKLPFVKTFAKKAIYDQLVNSSGLSFSIETIDVISEMKGVQTILSGDTVNLTGKMEYANIIANNVIIDGEITNDVIILSKSIFITEKAKIGGDLICVAADIDIKGNILGNVILSSNAAKISAIIGKDFRAASQKLEISASTEIKDNIYIETNSALNILDKYPNADVQKFISTEKISAKQNVIKIAKEGLIVVLSYMMLYYIIKKLCKNGITTYTNKVKQYPTFTILIGFAAVFIIPISIIILSVGCAFGLGMILGPILVVYIALIIAILWLALFITGTIIFEMINNKMGNKEENVKSKLLEMTILLLTFTVLYALKNWSITSEFLNSFIILVSIGSVITNVFKKEKTTPEIKENI